MKVWPFAAALAEGGCKPPHAALAEGRRGERCGKGARDASGGDREDGAQSPFFWGSLVTCRSSGSGTDCPSDPRRTARASVLSTASRGCAAESATGTSEQAIGRLKRLRDLGCEYAILYFPEAAYDRSGVVRAGGRPRAQL